MTKPNTLAIILFAVGACCIFIGFLYWQHIAWQNVQPSWAWNPGVFGDTFGILTSFLSLLALIGIFATYRKESQQLILLLEERRNAEVETARNELFDTYKIMLETKRMIIEVDTIDADSRRHASNYSKLVRFMGQRVGYKESTIVALYGVQNSWLNNSLFIVDEHPSLVKYFRYYLEALVASLDDGEVDGMRHVLDDSDLTFFAWMLATQKDDSISDQLERYLSSTTDAGRADVKRRLVQAEERTRHVLPVRSEI